MKDKSRPKNLPNDIALKTSTANLFLNIIIIILALLIIFMAYSLFSKIKALDENTTADGNNHKKIIQVEVLNGCGRAGVADMFTEYLRKHNFDVVHVGNYISFDVDNTLIIDRTGNKNNAMKVAEALGVDKKYIVQQLNNDYFLDVSIIIGKDFNQLTPNN